MAWVGNFMWWLCRAIGNAMTLTGLAGLLLFVGHGLVRVTETIIDPKGLERVSKVPEMQFRRLKLHFCVTFP